MDEIERRDCPGCGASNPPDAQHCWQCYARFDGSPAMAGAQAGSGVGLPMPPGPARVRPGFPPPQAPIPPPAPARRGGSTLARVGVGVIAAIVFWFAIPRLFGGGGVELPEQLDGQSRMHNATAQDMETQMRTEGDRYDLEIQAGLYGEPGFIVVVANGSARESSEELFDAFIDGVTRTGATVSEQELTGSFDGADYRCLTAEAGATDVGMCMWRADDHMGIVMGVDGDAAGTQALTGRIYTELTR
jgi:hypothetical protein